MIVNMEVLLNELTEDEHELATAFIRTLRAEDKIIVIIGPNERFISIGDTPAEDAILQVNRMLWSIDE